MIRTTETQKVKALTTNQKACESLKYMITPP